MAARLFLKSCALILMFTAVMKLLSAAQDTSLLKAGNPVFTFLTNRDVLMGVATLELLIAAALVLVDDLPLLTFSLVFWISSCFLIYRVTLVLTGDSGACFCLGLSSPALPFSKTAQEYLMRGLLCYMLIPSTYVLYYHRRRFRRPQSGIASQPQGQCYAPPN